jgi:hypothetical protein
MSDTHSVKLTGRSVRLIQVVGIPGNHSISIIKAVFIGVKEEVKAVCADVLDRHSIMIENPVYLRLVPDLRLWPKIVIRKIPQFDYDVGELFYPAMLDTIVTGNEATIALHAFPLFQQHYGATIPLLKEYSSILWDLATANGYTTEIMGAGLSEGEKVYTLNFPKLEIFEQHLLERMPQIYALARKIVKDDITTLARAA